MAILLSEQMAVFGENDLAVRAVRGLLGVMPFVSDWQHPGKLTDLAERLEPDHAERLAARAERLAGEPGPQAALKTFDLLDKCDKSIAFYSGIKAGVQGARGQAGALETDPQQAADAGLKALGVAYAAYKLMPGETAEERYKALLATDTGRAMLIFYVAVEVVLPFADNVASGGIDVMAQIIDRYAAENAQRLAAVAGGEVDEAMGMLAQLASTLKSFTGQAAAFARPLNDWCKEKLPGMLGKMDALGGMMATGVDALSTWRYMGAALVAEVCLAQALPILRAEIAQEAEEAARQRAFAPPPLPPEPDVVAPPPPASGGGGIVMGLVIVGVLAVICAGGAAAFFMMAPTTAPTTPTVQQPTQPTAPVEPSRRRPPRRP